MGGMRQATSADDRNNTEWQNTCEPVSCTSLPHNTHPVVRTKLKSQMSNSHLLVQFSQCVEASSLIREYDDVALQQRYGYVPRVERLAQELDQFRGDLGLRLTQADALQQRLQDTGQYNAVQRSTTGGREERAGERKKAGGWGWGQRNKASHVHVGKGGRTCVKVGMIRCGTVLHCAVHTICPAILHNPAPAPH